MGTLLSTAIPIDQLGCAGCGSCCEVIALDLRQDGMRLLFDTYPEQRAAPQNANAVWVVDHFTAISPEMAAAINFDLVRQMPGRSFYTCDAYDPETKHCTAYEQRPPLCRQFPGFDEEPNNIALRPHPQCSYWWAVPRKDWPMGMRPLPSPVVQNCC